MVEEEPSNSTTITLTPPTPFFAGAVAEKARPPAAPTVVIPFEAPPPLATLPGDNTDTEELSSSPLLEGLSSRPVPGGNWDPRRPLEWATDFGRRSPEDDHRLSTLARLHSGDDGYFDVADVTVPDVTMVRTREQARIVMQALMGADPGIFHACDTEVMDIALKEVGPVGNGYVTCVSVYSGPDFDYGFGTKGTTLWIDNLDDAYGVLQEFKEWFEDDRFLKVWHNYGFDRHVMWNEGIDCRGFGGDTMHMARLQDTSRLKNGGGGYSLEALTAELLQMRKRPMKEIFGVPRIRKDGSPGSLVDVPPIEVLQRDPAFRKNFIIYSCYDAVGTWQLHQTLMVLLKRMKWLSDDTNLYDYYWANMREFGEVLTDMERRGIRVDAKEYLASVEIQARQDREDHLRAFRRWAAKMIGVDGLALNPASSTQLGTFLFGGSENIKTRELTEVERVFKVAREELSQDTFDQLMKRDETTKEDIKNSGCAANLESDQLDQMKAAQLKALCKEYGLKVSGKKADLQDRLREYLLSNSKQAEEPNDDFDQMSLEELRQSLVGRNLDDTGEQPELLKRLRDDIQYMRDLETAMPPDMLGHSTRIIEALEAAAANGGVAQEILESMREKSSEEPKFVDVTIRSLGMRPTKHTAGGAPSATADVIRELAGDPFEDPPKYGSVSLLQRIL